MGLGGGVIAAANGWQREEVGTAGSGEAAAANACTAHHAIEATADKIHTRAGGTRG